MATQTLTFDEIYKQISEQMLAHQLIHNWCQDIHWNYNVGTWVYRFHTKYTR